LAAPWAEVLPTWWPPASPPARSIPFSA